MNTKAITVVEAALSEFERENQMSPRVILLPRELFRQFEEEQATIESVLPPVTIGRRERNDPAWADVRIVEHTEINSPEVY